MENQLYISADLRESKGCSDDGALSWCSGNLGFIPESFANVLCDF